MLQHNHRYGWRVDVPDIRDHVFFLTPPLTPKDLPTKVDLAAGFPAAYDQGDLGSCTANMAAAMIEYDRRRQGLVREMPSRLFCYYNSREHKGVDEGASIRDTVKAVNRFGCCPELDWLYQISRFARRPSKTAYAQGQQRQALKYGRVAQNVLTFKQTLAGGFPIGIGFSVYESFESDQVARTGKAPMPGDGERLLGGHAVVVVGYDDRTLRFKCRNSWGVSWGKKGYFTLPYEYVMNPDLAEDFWVVTLVEG